MGNLDMRLHESEDIDRVIRTLDRKDFCEMN